MNNECAKGGGNAQAGSAKLKSDLYICINRENAEWVASCELKRKRSTSGTDNPIIIFFSSLPVVE